MAELTREDLVNALRQLFREERMCPDGRGFEVTERRASDGAPPRDDFGEWEPFGYANIGGTGMVCWRRGR